MSDPQTAAGREPVTRGQIAIHQVEFLKEYPGACAQVSFRAGMHPYYRWTGETFERAEPVGFGELEVEAVDEDTLIRHMTENPVELMPIDEAEFSPEEPGRAKVWERVDADEEVSADD